METVVLFTSTNMTKSTYFYYAGVLIVTLLTTISFLRYYLRRPTRLQPLADGKEAPEALGSWPILGHIPMLVMNRPLLHRLFAELADQHGPAFTVRAGQLRILVVSSWEMAKECLFVNDRALADRPDLLAWKHLPPLFALAPHGPFWRDSRKILVQNVLSSANLQSFQSLWVSEVGDLVRQLYARWLRNGQEPVDMKQRFLGTMLNNVTRVVAGKRYSTSAGIDQEGDAEARQFIRLFKETLYYLGLQDVGDAFPFLRRFDLLGNGRALKKIGREVDELMQKWIDEHRLRANNIICSSSAAAAASAGIPVRDADAPSTTPRDKDLIDLLLLSEKENTLPDLYPSNHFIKGFLYVVILGGTDTTAITLSWALSLLVNNRHVLEKAYAELDLHVGRDRIVEASDITKLVYLQSIVKEALRLYPPGPLLAPHRAMEDCRIGGFHVPKGTTVMINAWKMHRDPRIFVNPLEFRPERFMEENKEMDVMGQQFMLIPFGFGRRGCPGANMALRVVHLALARLLQAFDWAPPSGRSQLIDMNEAAGISLEREHPLELLLTPRLSPQLYYK